MSSKTYTLFVDGEDAVEYGTKKTAVKYGEESGKTFQVHSPSGAVVHAFQAGDDTEKEEEPAAVQESEETVHNDGPEEDLIGDVEPAAEEPEVLYYEFIDFPGNYSIVTAPGALEIAEAAGVPAKSENVKGRLNRVVHFGGDDMDKAKAVSEYVTQAVAQALEDLKAWQKKNIEKRRDLTDMQRYVQHREFIAGQLHKSALAVKKNGLPV